VPDDSEYPSRNTVCRRLTFHLSRQPPSLLFATAVGNLPLSGFARALSPAAAAQLRVGQNPRMPTVSSNLDLKTYKSAIRDFFLRTIFSLTILAVGYWLPSSYLLDKYGIFAQFGCGTLAETTFSLSKLLAFIFAAMAVWGLRCAFVALWSPPQDNEEAQQAD